jgi:hypothetical protein
MAARYFRGDAPAVAKVYTITAAGVPVAGDTITISFKDAAGGNVVRSHTYTLTDGLLATISAALAAMINNSVYEEVLEVAATDSGAGVVVLTQIDQYKGETLFVEVSKTGTVTIAIATTTASSGPGDWNLATNWVGGVAAGAADDPYLDGLPYDITDSLASIAQVLSTRIINCKNIGRPLHNGRYREWRPRYLAALMSKLYINSPESDLLRIDLLALASVVEVIVDDIAINGSEEGMEALCLKCSGANGFNLTVNRGSVGVAAFEGETAKVPSIIQNYRDSPSDTHIRCGLGATLTNVYRSGGSFIWGTALTTFEQREQAGEAIFNGGAVTIANVNLFAGSLVMLPTATTSVLTNIIVGSGCVLDLSKCSYPVQCPNSIVAYKDAEIIDPFDRLQTLVGSTPTITIQPAGCNLADIKIVRKTNKSYTGV